MKTKSKTQEFINAMTNDLEKRETMKRRFNAFIDFVKVCEMVVQSQSEYEDYKATWSNLSTQLIDEWIMREWKKANRHKEREQEVHETILMLAAFYDYLRRVYKPIENPAAQSLLHMENGIMKRRRYNKRAA